MSEQIVAQPYIALTCLYAGLACGLTYDLLRLPRYLCRLRIVKGLCDLLFVVSLGVVLAATLLLTTGGKLRLYLFLFAGAGFAVEQFAVFGTISRIVHTRARKRAGNC